jgi:hypothetical protein
MISGSGERVRDGRRIMRAILGVSATLLLAACAGKHAAPADQAQQQQQQSLTSARNLCRGFGYTPGSAEFARCAQTEYDRIAAAPPAAAPPAANVPAAANAPAKADDDDWLIQYMKRPAICGRTASCSVW